MKRPMNRTLLTSVLGMLLVSGCSGFSDRMVERANDTGGWISEQLSGTGKAKDAAELVEFTPQFKPVRIWRKSLGDSVGRGFPKPVPAMVNQQITVIDDHRRGVVSWDYSTRKKLWSSRFEERIAGGIGGDENRIYLATRDAKLLALSAESGELLWQQQMPSEVLAPPVSNNRVVVVATSDGKLIGLNADDGQQRWLTEREVPALSLRGSSTPLIVGDMVVKGFADGRLVALELDTGFDLWDAPVAIAKGRSELDRMVDADATPVADGGVIYTSAYQGRVVAIGQNSGEVLWSRSISSFSGIAVDLFNIYLTDDQDTVWALDRRTGATYWKQDALEARRVSGPAVIDDYIVVSDFEGYLHWMDRENGAFVARNQPIDGPALGPLRVIDNQLYLFSEEGDLVILAASPPADEG